MLLFFNLFLTFNTSDPNRVDTYLLADGGLWANNPALVGLTEAIGKLKVNKDDIKILSIGTGIGNQYYDIDGSENKHWGLISGWQGSKLVDTILNLQSMSSENIVKLILGDSKYLRLNFNSDTKLALDKLDMIDSLKSRADQTLTYEINKIKRFLFND